MSFTVQEVAQLLKQSKENKKPYVFFTGAGCSISAGVPSATSLIEEIRTQFPIQVKNINHEKDKYNYGKYMSALDKSERRELLKPHIVDNKKINWAHIALACLMQAGYIERVLTFNFDSILSRACNMLGLHPSIYDFATANPHLYHLISDPSIVHLHGQGTGFIQLNTKEETQDHTEKLGDFIASTLNSNPSLFIGYSGNADEFFPLLEKKYSEQHRLIWTGRKESIDDIEANSVKEFLKKNNNLTHYIGDIDADHFLIQLAKELDCFPPELFSNPYKFLNQQLENVQKYPLGDGLDILANLTDYLKQQSEKPLIKSLYTSFIHKFPTRESVANLSENEIDQIMWAYDKQARLLSDNNKYDEAINLYENAKKIDPSHFGCLFNYALLLQNIANSNNKDTENLIKKSIKLYKKCLDIQNNNEQAWLNLSHALLVYAELKKDPILLNEAYDVIKKSITLSPNKTYNLACYFSIIGKKDLAKDNLFKALSHDTLPDLDHLNTDKDLDNIRNDQWFIELLERLKAKEEIA
jgi:tetratricopeptide (TPR) repeat protein